MISANMSDFQVFTPNLTNFLTTTINVVLLKMIFEQNLSMHTSYIIIFILNNTYDVID